MKIVEREDVSLDLDDSYTSYHNPKCKTKCRTFYVLTEHESIKDTERKCELRCTECGEEFLGDIDIVILER